jgi:hypothetical protein
VVDEIAEGSAACDEVEISIVVPAEFVFLLASLLSRYIAHIKLELRDLVRLHFEPKTKETHVTWPVVR